MVETFQARRAKLMENKPAPSLVCIFSGNAPMKSLDEAYPFAVDRNFYYLTGIDRENMAKQINLRYTRDEKEAVASVRSGDSTAAFLLNATSVEEIRAVAEAGDKMPQKSTYFYPKLKTGLVMNKM